MNKIKKVTAAGLLAMAVSGTANACGDMPFIGQVCTFAFDFCPKNFVPANGGLLPISQYTALFSLVGTTYGGNGQTTFAVPDLRGRSVVGTGEGPGLSPVMRGQTRGSESATLTAANLPSANVNVVVKALQANATETTPNAGSLLAITYTGDRASRTQQPTYAPGNASGTQVPLGGVSGSLSGSNVPFQTLPPQLGMTTCIAVNGIFPQRP